jgi:D-3-phosphoglycerate dehydrogenase
MKKSAALLNFARGEIVVEDDVLSALDADRLSAYICDFPSKRLKDHPNVVALPHLGASTGEAEENCAIFAVDTLRDFLENGNIRNSINFPEAISPRITGTYRLVIANKNVPNMVGQISTALANASLNIANLLNKSRADIAYTIIDMDAPIPETIIPQLQAIKGVLSARLV